MKRIKIRAGIPPYDLAVGKREENLGRPSKLSVRQKRNHQNQTKIT